MVHLTKRFASEAIGTFLLIFIGVGSIYYIEDYYLYGVGAVGSALAFGLVYMALWYPLGPISGSHLNPAVSLAALCIRRISIVEMLVDWLAQIIGAFISVFALGGILGANFDIMGYNDITNLPNEFSAVVTEILLTFFFIFCLLCVQARKDTYHLTGLIGGFALTGATIVGINMTGASLNPARSIATAVYSLDLEVIRVVWVFIVGPLIGGLLAAVAALWFATPEKKGDTKAGGKKK